jgi:phenylalanyl-tRNA synthetase beta chain
MLERMGLYRDLFRITPIDGKKDLYAGGLEYRYNNLPIAELAVIKPALLRQFDIKNDVFYATVYWGNVIRIRGEHHISFSELPRFPEVRRDLALLVDQALTYDRIRELANRIESKLLTRVDLFDVYEGEQVAPGKKSYAVSFILQDKEATLTDEKIDRIINRLMEAYVGELGAVIRK